MANVYNVNIEIHSKHQAVCGHWPQIYHDNEMNEYPFYCSLTVLQLHKS